MNGAIADAFETGGWAFVIPLLVIQAGRSTLMVVVAPTWMLREHYGRLLCWILADLPRSPARAHTARILRSVGASATRILAPACPPSPAYCRTL
jgi:hypothetical protein